MLTLILFFSILGYLGKVGTKSIQSTDLSGENINGITILQSIHSEELIKKNITPVKRLENLLDSNYYELSNGLIIAINKDDLIEKIIVTSSTSNKTFKTARSISLGDSLEKVIKTYGGNYYKQESELTSEPITGYMDIDEKIKIEFWSYEGKVDEIRIELTNY